MEAFNEFLNSFDLAKLLPQIADFAGDLRLWCCIAMLLGPLLLLGLGAWYFLAPPEKANHHVGFRIYYGMGSDAAWKFTQRLAGVVWGALGAVLTVVMGIICLICAAQSLMAHALLAVICVLLETVLVLAGYVFIQLTVRKHFDKNGNHKKS